MTKPSWKLWKAELKAPTPEADRAQRSTDPLEMTGYWRVRAARTKTDWPVAIWTRHQRINDKEIIGEWEDATIFQIGHRIQNTVENADAWQQFTEGRWLSCTAVTREEWAAALDLGRWEDGKPAKRYTDQEKLQQAADIIPGTPADEGGNTGEDLTLDQQIDARMKAQIAAHKALGKIDSQEKATKAAAILEAIRALGKLGNAKREEDRAPHLAAAQMVQNVWLPILAPGSELVPVIVKEIADYAAAEKARLQAIENAKAEAERKRLQAIKDEEARVERERLQKIADEEADAERQRLQKLADDAAAAKGEEAEVVEVKAEEVVVEAEVVEVVAEQVATPKVSTQFGRAVSKAKVKKGRITNRALFVAALEGQADFDEWLQNKANALARAKITLKGMEIYEE